MAKYLLVFHGGGMPETDVEQQRVMAAWTDWYTALGSSVADTGNPDRAVDDDRERRRRDRRRRANPASGYAVIEAESLDDAAAKSKGCPILEGGGSIEVAETFDVM